MDEYIKYAKIIVEILKSTISGGNYKISDDIDLKKLYDVSKAHMVENILYYQLEKSDLDKNLDIIKKFSQSRDKASILYVNQELYFNQICSELTKHKIKYMPLKGSITRYLYPSPDMRQSSDIDIYFDKEKAGEVKEILEKMGFKNIHFGSDQDLYRLGIVFVEMHRELVPPRSKQFKIIEGFINRATSEDGIKFNMTNEDFYVFNVIHIAKHVKEGGIGIKSVLDLWVFLNKYKNELNYEIINERIKEAELKNFEKHLLDVCDFWFNGKTLDDEKSKKLETFMLTSGWNGSLAKRYAMTSEEYVNDIKIVYYLKYIFKKPSELNRSYTFLKKYPYLVPLVWIHRIYSAVFKRKGAVKKFIHRYDGIEKSEIDALKAFSKEIGL